MIRNKTEFLQLQKKFTFGNRLIEWHSIKELKDSGHTEPVSLRYRKAGYPFMRYDVPIAELDSLIDSFVKQGADRNLFWANETTNDDDLLFQGEAMLTHEGLVLFCSDEQKKMRIALANSGYHVKGLKARMLVKNKFSPSSLSDFEALLNKYPNSVIEFSAYTKNLGCIPGRNVIFWEVRDY